MEKNGARYTGVRNNSRRILREYIWGGIAESTEPLFVPKSAKAATGQSGAGNIANAVLGALGSKKHVPTFEMFTEGSRIRACHCLKVVAAALPRLPH